MRVRRMPRLTPPRDHRTVDRGVLPLTRWRALVTPPAAQARPLPEAPAAAAAVRVSSRTVEVVAPPDWALFDDAFAAAAAATWVVFTSPSAVRLAAARLRETGQFGNLATAHIAAVGPGTARAL